MINKILLSAFYILLSISLNCGYVFAAGPWKGKIIDIETKEPLEDAVVLAVWQRAYRTLAGANTYFYEAKEVLTNKEGTFEIPSYTPINLLPIVSYIREPEFTIFKPGYLSIDIRLDENVTDKAVELPEKGKVFRLSPGIIELPKLKTREERIKSLNAVETVIDSSVPEEKFKNTLKMVDIENRNLGFRK
ncbi:MAG: hypothetical protein HZA14_04745 [Nitrospirae bacterium]|nr:hypothetical protein [Nitrospirota bacterium]